MRSIQVASNDCTSTGSFHKCMYVGVQLNRCCVVCISVLQRVQYGKVCVFASTLCKYDLKTDVLFVLNWASVPHISVTQSIKQFINFVKCI